MKLVADNQPNIEYILEDTSSGVYFELCHLGKSFHYVNQFTVKEKVYNFGADVVEFVAAEETNIVIMTAPKQGAPHLEPNVKVIVQLNQSDKAPVALSLSSQSSAVKKKVIAIIHVGFKELNKDFDTFDSVQKKSPKVVRLFPPDK